MKYRLSVSSSLESDLKIVPPELKRKIRAALDSIQDDPWMGKPLNDELEGYRSVHVHRYRIVYQINSPGVEIRVIDIGPRNIIYERMVEFLKRSLTE